MNLKHFKAFRAVMLSGSAIEASRRLSLTPSAVSRLISGMEEQIGFKLFARVGRRLSPTPEGEAFFAETETVLKGFDEILSIADDIRTHRSARLRLGAISLLAHGLLPKSLSHFLDDHPMVRVRMSTQRQWDFGYWASMREFDLGCTILPAVHPSVGIEVFATVGGVVALPLGHPLAEHDSLNARDIRKEPMIVQAQNALIRNHIATAFEQADIRLNPHIETVSSLSACQLVSQGIGIAVIDGFTAQAFPSEKLIYRPWRENLALPCAFVVPETLPQSKVVQDFKAAVRKTVGELANDSPHLFRTID